MNTTGEQKLKPNSVGLFQIIAFVIATNGPLIGLVGAVPVALILGNGIGLAGTFLLVGLVYLIFSVGFAAMARYIKNAGAFYTYVRAGLGQSSGFSAASLALCSYICIQLTCYALIGFFMSQFELSHFGESVPWWCNSLVISVIILFCGYRKLELSGKVLGLLMLFEISIVLAFDVSIVAHGGGPEGLSLSPFLPENIFSAGLGAALVFTIGSYVGFETTAIYSEEARNPRKTIPTAMYMTILLIMSFLAFSVWAVIIAYGPSNIIAASQHNPGELWFAAASKFLSPSAADAMSFLMITSLFAATLSLQNAVARYFFSLSRDNVIWRKMALVHPVQDSPYVASFFNSFITITAVVAFALLGADPMTTVLPVTTGFASIALLIVQGLTSLAVIKFFRKREHSEGTFKVMVAPLISTCSLVVLIYFIVSNIGLLTDGNIFVGQAIVASVIIVALGGALYAKLIPWQKLETTTEYD